MNSRPNDDSKVSESNEDSEEMVEVLINLIENLKYILYFETDDNIHFGDPMGTEGSSSQAKSDKDIEFETWSPSIDAELYPIATCVVKSMSEKEEVDSDSSEKHTLLPENDSAECQCLSPSTPVSDD